MSWKHIHSSFHRNWNIEHQLRQLLEQSKEELTGLETLGCRNHRSPIKNTESEAPAFILMSISHVV
jgi:hypothetical protein